jgi:uncharacterized secreted protein with C-terminal beta-propeller domain
MAKMASEVNKIRHIVNTEVARLAFQGNLVDRIDSLPKELTDSWVVDTTQAFLRTYTTLTLCKPGIIHSDRESSL